MKTEEAIKYAGSVTELASLLGITAGAVSQWGDYPPDGRQLQLEQLSKKTRNKLKAEPGCLERLLNPPKRGEPAH
jgi:predicted transcriptional regulator